MIDKNRKNVVNGYRDLEPPKQNERDAQTLFTGNVPDKRHELEHENIADFVRNALRRNVLGGHDKK